MSASKEIVVSSSSSSSYSQSISSLNPGLIMILIDQSYSMRDAYGGQTKADVAAMAVNRVIYEIVESSQAGEEIKNRCYIGVVGYGESISPIVGGMISELAKKPLDVIDVMKKVPDGAGGLVEIREKMPIWVRVKAENGTPMGEAMESVYNLISEWIQEHSKSFPPIVINITDGDPNDKAKAEVAAKRLMSLRSADGNLLLFNAHISNSNAGEVKLPNSENGLFDEYAKFLFRVSSVLPAKLVTEAQNVGFSPQPQARGFVFNAGAETLIKLLTFGTTGTLR